MSNIFGAALALTSMAQSSTYKRAYKKFGTKTTKDMLHSMQRHATSIHPSNKNMFKEALAYKSSNQSKNKKTSPSTSKYLSKAKRKANYKTSRASGAGLLQRPKAKMQREGSKLRLRLGRRKR